MFKKGIFIINNYYEILIKTHLKVLKTQMALKFSNLNLQYVWKYAKLIFFARVYK